MCHQAPPALSGVSTHCSGCQVYHTEAGTRHKFFRVYPYVKQLRRWIKNKRKEQSSSRHTVAAPPSNSNAVSSQLQAPHKQQPAGPAMLPEGACKPPQPDQNQEHSNFPAMDIDANTRAAVVPMPAPITHCSVPEQPGQAWLKFALNREQVLRHLIFHALPQTAH